MQKKIWGLEKSEVWNLESLIQGSAFNGVFLNIWYNVTFIYG